MVENNRLVFTWDHHHAGVEDNQLIKLEWMMGEKNWQGFDEPKELNFEKYLDNLDFDDTNEYD